MNQIKIVLISVLLTTKKYFSSRENETQEIENQNKNIKKIKKTNQKTFK